MRIFRVEKSGVGPWSHQDTSLSFASMTSEQPGFADNCAHPTPQDENLRFWNGTDVCACTSLEMLFRWFYTDRVINYLEKHGFRINEYEIDRDDVVIGQWQCVYDPKDVVNKVASHSVLDKFVNQTL